MPDDSSLVVSPHTICNQVILFQAIFTSPNQWRIIFISLVCSHVCIDWVGMCKGKVSKNNLSFFPFSPLLELFRKIRRQIYKYESSNKISVESS